MRQLISDSRTNVLQRKNVANQSLSFANLINNGAKAKFADSVRLFCEVVRCSALVLVIHQQFNSRVSNGYTLRYRLPGFSRVRPQQKQNARPA